MMSHLISTSDAVFVALLPSYESVLDELNTRKHAWGEDTKEAEEEAEGGRNNPYKTLIGQLLGWLRQLPVIGFNSGKYDLNMIKRSFVPLLISNNAAVIKRQNTYMCLYTDKLKFVDICHFLAPGVSYAKRTAASWEKGTSHTSTWTTYISWRIAFYHCRPRSTVATRTKASPTMITHDVYKYKNIDMFKDGISVPGLSLLHLFNDLPNDTNFVTFNRTNSDLHQLVKDNIVGGPAIIFHRYHEKDVTKIRGGGETCRSIVGYDANALYLRDGACVVGRRTGSVRNRHSFTDRWPSSGSRANRSERVSASVIRLMVVKSG